MTTRVRIDLAAKVLEAEGSEEFVRELYHDFRDHVVPAGSGVARALAVSSAPSPGSGPKVTDRKGTSKTRSGKQRAPEIAKDLDLATKGARLGLKDAMKPYRQLKGAWEFNAFFVYYLKKTAELDSVTMDHVYTCYRHAGAKPPTAFTQSLRDTAHRKGTIDVTSLEDIKVTIAGENWVEHDLEKAAQKSD